MCATTGRAMKRRRADLVTDVDKARIGVEQPPDLSRVVARDRVVQWMAVGSGRNAPAAIPRLFQETHDPRMTTIARHDDQAAVVQSVPLRIGTGVEQDLHGFRMPFTNGKVNRRRVPVLRTAEPGVAFDQLAQRGYIAIIRCGECIPDDAPLHRIEFRWLDDRATSGADNRLDVAAQGVPGCEAVAFRCDALRVPQTPDVGLTPQQFLGLTLELIEMRTSGQRPSRHTDLLPKLA